MGKIIDLTGQRFGRLTVIEQVEPYISPKGHKAIRWLCCCDCGNEKTVTHGHLCSGATISCGCYHSDELTKRNTKHGEASTKLYGIYRGIKIRCYDPNHQDYQRYGQRGIAMCEEWKNDFQAFRDWAYANGYNEEVLPNGRVKWTIDRIDNNGNYCPENCRWITLQEQACNRSSNYRIEYKGKTQTIAEWAKELGMPYITLHDRLLRNNCDLEKALQKPYIPCSRRKTV